MLTRPRVSILIVTYNSERHLDSCLQAALAQDTPAEVIVVDNASRDGTRNLLERLRGPCRLVLNHTNTGFAAAVNQAMRAARGEWLLTLNPDVVLAPGFLRRLLAYAEVEPRLGCLCGKLLRMHADTGERLRVLDSTGIYFQRNLRHLDRGADELDDGQYGRPEFVFGATGAAALFRRAMVEDVSVEGEFFDESFFAYREDADLAWRAQLFGWKCLYVPSAIGWHVRRVTPQTVRAMPPEIQMHSVKNRFAMRLKNLTPEVRRAVFWPALARDALIVGYALLRNWRLLRAFALLWSARRQLWRKRRLIQARTRVPEDEIVPWFGGRKAAELDTAALYRAELQLGEGRSTGLQPGGILPASGVPFRAGTTDRQPERGS